MTKTSHSGGCVKWNNHHRGHFGIIYQNHQRIYSMYPDPTDLPTCMKQHTLKFIHSSIVHLSKIGNIPVIYIQECNKINSMVEYYAGVKKHEEALSTY